MVPQKSHHPLTEKDDLPHPAVTPPHLRETIGPTSNAMAGLSVAAAPSAFTLVDIYGSDTVDPEYQAKSHAISCAIQEIGIGRYQVRLRDLFDRDSKVFC